MKAKYIVTRSPLTDLDLVRRIYKVVQELLLQEEELFKGEMWCLLVHSSGLHVLGARLIGAGDSGRRCRCKSKREKCRERKDAG